MSENQHNMLLIKQKTAAQKNNFSLIPIKEDCPFVEVIFVPETKSLVILSKIQKDTFHFFPRLDDNGDVVGVKDPRKTQRSIKEERKQIKTYYEYHLTEVEDQEAFIEMFGLNHSTFPWKTYYQDAAETAKPAVRAKKK